MLARVSRIFLPPLIVVAVLFAFRLATGSLSPGRLELPRDKPWTIAPRYDRPEVVTDEQLYAVLDRVKPPAGRPDTNKMIHALRLWGSQAHFDDPAIPSGKQLRAYFLDDAEFQRQNGPGIPPLFKIGPDGGVYARAWNPVSPFKTTSSYHEDDLLATLAEIGTPLDTPLVTRNGTTTVAALLDSAMRRFHLSQHEYEWSTISYARYVFPLETWRNAYHQRIDASSMVEELITHPLARGTCNGTHRLEAMVVLYRADEQAQALPPRVRRRIIDHLTQISAILIAAQSEKGYWTRRWPQGAAAREDTTASLYDRILVTGHHLEWLALAPPEAQPPREHIIRAAQWLVRAMQEIDDKTVDRAFGPLSHAARALCLWRSKDPFQTWNEGRRQSAEGLSDGG